MDIVNILLQRESCYIMCYVLYNNIFGVILRGGGGYSKGYYAAQTAEDQSDV